MTTDMGSGEQDYCPSCKMVTIVVEDYRTGDTICTECALVLEARIVDPTQEWRTFADDNDSGADPNRVGSRINPLLDGRGLAPTLVSRPKTSKGQCTSAPSRYSAVAHSVSRVDDPYRALVQSFEIISDMCERLNLSTKTKDRAKEIYMKLEESNCLLGKGQYAILAACLFVSCRLEQTPRTLKEIRSVHGGAKIKIISKEIRFVERKLDMLGYTMENTTANARDFMKRFCFGLGLGNEAVKAAVEAARKVEELDIRRSPVSVAAAIIYMITQLTSYQKSLQDVSVATKMTESTIKKAYKDLYPYASFLIPSSFAEEAELAKLYKP